MNKAKDQASHLQEETQIKLTSDLSQAIFIGGKQWSNTYKILKEKRVMQGFQAFFMCSAHRQFQHRKSQKIFTHKPFLIKIIETNFDE